MSEQKFLNSARTAELWEKVKEYVNENGGGSGGEGGGGGSPTSSSSAILRKVTLSADDWTEDKTQTVTVKGILSDVTRQIIQPIPFVEYQDAYYNANILCVNQSRNSLEFRCNGEVPLEDIKLYIAITNAKLAQSADDINTFGVVWNYANPSTALERLTIASDPYGYVTDTPDSEPIPAIGNTDGYSPFDNFMPWYGMQEFNVIGSSVQYEYGSQDFSRTLYDTMVHIPEFWYKIVDDSVSQKRYFYISNSAASGFEKHPGSGKYVSRYTANANYKSISGNQSVVNITRATARTNAKAKGTGWSLYDFASLCAAQLLYLVEYADWDSQAKIGRGYVDGNSTQINTGATDSMAYHTGRAAGVDGKTAIQYRHIENMWGNLYQWVDGINFSERKAYVCTTPSAYADDTATGYIDTGITLPTTDNYITGLGVSDNNSWVLIPNNSTGGRDSTYIPDHVYSGTGWRALYVGGFWSLASLAGAFCFRGYDAANYSAALGARLLFTP